MVASKETIDRRENELLGNTNLTPIVDRFYGSLYQFAVRLSRRIGCRGSGSADVLHADPTPTSGPGPIEHQMLVVHHAAPEVPDGSSPAVETSRNRVPARCPRIANRGSKSLE
jgi:hypothetical protein